jgi:hypothetical protein
VGKLVGKLNGGGFELSKLINKYVWSNKTKNVLDPQGIRASGGEPERLLKRINQVHPGCYAWQLQN